MSANESMQHGETQHVGAATRTVKRARLEADKRRDVLEKVQDKYADHYGYLLNILVVLVARHTGGGIAPPTPASDQPSHCQ